MHTCSTELSSSAIIPASIYSMNNKFSHFTISNALSIHYIHEYFINYTALPAKYTCKMLVVVSVHNQLTQLRYHRLFSSTGINQVDVSDVLLYILCVSTSIFLFIYHLVDESFLKQKEIKLRISFITVDLLNSLAAAKVLN